MSFHVSETYADPRAPQYRKSHYADVRRSANRRLLDGLMGQPANPEDRHAIVAELRRHLHPTIRDRLNREGTAAPLAVAA